MPGYSTEVSMAILRHVAHSAGEDTDSRDGWCRWGVPDGNPWSFGDYKSLVTLGLLERRETWKDILLRLTDAGWQMVNGRSEIERMRNEMLLAYAPGTLINE